MRAEFFAWDASVSWSFVHTWSSHTVFQKLARLFHVHRSRDVAELHANMTFNPVKINMQQSQCEHNGRKSVCVTAEVCFAYSIKADKPDLNNTGEPSASRGDRFVHLLQVLFSRYIVLSIVSRRDSLRSDSGRSACESQGLIHKHGW